MLSTGTGLHGADITVTRHSGTETMLYLKKCLSSSILHYVQDKLREGSLV